MARILIVDDEAPVRHFLALLMEQNGHTTLLAINGLQALDLVRAEIPDLVITDVMMPVLDGRQLTRAIKAEAGTRHIPVILMSAAGRQAADGAGADAFISKPFSLDDMETLVRRQLS
jgi:CheY-like chemotaxis protein